MRRKIRDIIWLIRSKFYKNVLVCFGTSLTETGGWVNMLREKLPQWHIINFGKGGMNSNWGFDNLGWVLRFKPKMVLMEFTINDAYINDDLYCPTSLSESCFNIRVMIKMLKEINCRVFYLGMNPPLNEFLCDRNPSEVRPSYEQYWKEHKEVVESEEVKFIDITNEWDKLDRKTFLKYCPDGLHPNELGSKMITVPKIMEEVFK